MVLPMRPFRNLCSLALAKRNLWGSEKAECHLHTMVRVCAFIPSHRACAENLLCARPCVYAASMEMKVCSYRSQRQGQIERNPKATHLAKYRGRRDHGMSPYMSSGMGRKKRKKSKEREGERKRGVGQAELLGGGALLVSLEEESKNY